MKPEDIESAWRKYDDMEARLSAGVSERMLDLVGLRPGMNVLDLATGRGEPALRAARRVGERGSVVGVDRSEEMLRISRELAARDGLTNLELRVMNAEELSTLPPAHFDVATVRWGLMYMNAPMRCLSGARRALKLGGAFIAAVWAEPERVSWATLPRRVLERYRSMPAVDRNKPGAFYYAEPGRLERDLERSGYAVEHVEEIDVAVVEAPDGIGIVRWVRELGLMPLVNELSPSQTEAWERDLANEAEKFRQGDMIRLGGVTRLVVARATEI